MGNVSILPVGFGNINENEVITDYELFGFVKIEYNYLQIYFELFIDVFY